MELWVQLGMLNLLLWMNLREVRSAWSRHLILVASHASGTADAILQSGVVYNLRLFKSQMGSYINAERL